MKPCTSIGWLSLWLGVLGCRLVLADDTQIRSGTLHLSQASGFAAGQRVPEGRPIVRVAFREPEVIEPGKPFFPPQLGFPAALTLEGLEQIALQSNPTLVQARMAVRAAQGGYVQAGLYPNPVIGYAGGDMGLEGTSGQQGGVFGQEIVTSGKLRLGRAVAGYGVQQARYGWEAQRRRVLNGVRAGYYEVLLAQKMIEVNEQLVRIAAENVKVAEQLKAALDVSEVDVLQIRIEAEQARLSLKEAENRHRTAWQRLAAVLGRPEMEPAPLAGDVAKELPALGWEDTLVRLLSQSPELGRARAGIERARCQLALECAQRVPNLEVEVWTKHDATTDESLADVGLGLPLPLFDRNQGNIVSAQAVLIAAQNELRRTELELRDRFAAAFEHYANARRRVDTYTITILPNAKESLRLMGILKREGELGYLTLLTAQRTYFSVNLDYLANLRELWARTVELEGMLLSGGLQGAE